MNLEGLDTRHWDLHAVSRALREAWGEGRTTIGPWVASGSPEIVELVCRPGFDWITIDGQHGRADASILPGLLRAAAISRTPTFVRTKQNDFAEIGQALDYGANGVIVPLVNTKPDAEAAAAACRYPPTGQRSWGPFRGGTYSDVSSGKDAGDVTAICLVMAETVEACENIEEIVSVPGIDGVFIGPIDLAISAGATATLQMTDPEVRALVRRVRDACRAAGKVAGTFPALDDLGEWVDEGFQYLGLMFDTEVLLSAARERHAIVRQVHEARRAGA